MKRNALHFLIIILMSFSSILSAETLYVRHETTSPDAWSGMDPVYASITTAIASAKAGDQIWVAAGEYVENICLNNGIHLYGGFSGIETSLNDRENILENLSTTTINGNNAGRCILTSSETLIDGFTLINGNAPLGAGISIWEGTDIVIRNVAIHNCFAEWMGAGIYIESPHQSGAIVIERVLISDCTAYCGALEVADITTATITIRQCTIVNNNCYGLEIPYHEGVELGTTEHDFYNTIIWNNENQRAQSYYANVWGWARDVTDNSYIGNAPWRGMRNRWGDPLPGNLFESDSQVGNPQFIDAENGDFQLNTDSPCIGGGRGSGDIGIFPGSETTQPILSVFPSNINFGYTEDVQTVYITNVGTGNLNWNVSENAESINIQSTKSGHLGLNETAVVNIQIDRDKLAAGTNYELITLVSNGGARMLSISAENGTPPPEISLQRDVLLFTGLEGGPNPLSQTIQVDLTNATGLVWQATDLTGEGWLDINAETLSDSLGAIRTAVDISNLPSGFYVSKISINSPTNEFEPVYVQIHLFLNSEAPPLLIAEMEAENGAGVFDQNWELIETNDHLAIEAVGTNPTAPDSEGWLEYEFTVPENISEIYVFTEYTLTDTTQANFCWLGLNENVIFRWQSMPKIQDEWQRTWVTLGSSTTPIAFPVTTGQNTLRLNPGSMGVRLNWLVVSSDPNLDISKYGFGQGLLPISAVEDCPGIESTVKPATDFSLLANYPNPFNPTTRISFTLNHTQMVTVAIYNSLGQHVKTLSERMLPAGAHQLSWDGLDKMNQPVKSGIYLARLQSANNSRIIKMTLLK